MVVCVAAVGCRKKGELSPGMKIDTEKLTDTTEVKFDEREHNFGDIAEGDTFVHNFKFTNVGKKDFVIVRAIGSCGCTVPDYPRQPIPPGGTGEIRVKFDSHGKKDAFTKTVTLTCNTETRQEVLYIKGNVLPKAGEEQSDTTKAK